MQHVWLFRYLRGVNNRRSQLAACRAKDAVEIVDGFE
jgi:hypothetical protein